jgi:glycosyltransferase involved in cell wall biosynthesis
MKNTIALCIPAYNAAWCLPRLLQSALDQSIQFDEILVYNDCSTDETEKVAKQYGAKVVNGITNKGCSFGKNVLIGETSCNWIHFHDADDELLPNFTTLAHKWIEDSNCPDIVLFDYNYINNLDHKLIAVRRFDKQKLIDDPIAYSLEEQINPFCGLYRKSALVKAGGYEMDEKLLYNEDSAFHMKMAIAGLTFSSEDEVAIINYAVNGSMSDSNKKKCVIAQYYALLMAKEQLEKIGKLNSYKKLLSLLFFKKAILLAAYHTWTELDEALKLSKTLDQSRKKSLRTVR